MPAAVPADPKSGLGGRKRRQNKLRPGDGSSDSCHLRWWRAKLPEFRRRSHRWPRIWWCPVAMCGHFYEEFGCRADIGECVGEMLVWAAAAGNQCGCKSMAGRIFRHAAIALSGLRQEATALQCRHTGQGPFSGGQPERQSQLWCVWCKREVRNDAKFFVGVCSRRQGYCQHQQR